VQSSYHSGYTQLQAAKKLNVSFLMQFAIFSREQQHLQRDASSGQGSRAADLVSPEHDAIALRDRRLSKCSSFTDCL
jgi:hypothetical protein